MEFFVILGILFIITMVYYLFLTYKKNSKSRNNQIKKIIKRAPSETKKIVVGNEQKLQSSSFNINLNTVTTKTFFSRHSKIVIAYLTDLHLMHYIQNCLNQRKTFSEIENLFDSLCRNIRNDMNEKSATFLCLGGDISSDFEIYKIFFEKLFLYVGKEQIIVIMGNHEFWDSKLYKNIDSDKNDMVFLITQKYRDFFNENQVLFLQNEIAFFSYKNKFLVSFKINKVSGDYLINHSKEDIYKEFNDFSFCVLGGVGFSGNNPSYNATNGLYRQAITTIEEDKKHSFEFESIYNSFIDKISLRKRIVLTHNPINDWTSKFPAKNIFYINGHTHKNSRFVDSEYHIYSDNQNGYSNKNVNLKTFSFDGKFDYFDFYKDGVYSISNKEYFMFYLGIQCEMSFTRPQYQIYLLKKRSLYCFIAENKSNKKLFILNGGNISSLDPSHDINYYFTNLDIYTEKINEILCKYKLLITDVSKFVSSIGGDGRIHGCIVDIDFFNHLYVNPLDNSITPYYAIDITKKYVYKNIASLLYFKCNNLYESANQIVAKNEYHFLTKIDQSSIDERFKLIQDTQMYKYSRIMLKIQYQDSIKVVRTWNDDILLSHQSSGKQINDKIIMGIFIDED